MADKVFLVSEDNGSRVNAALASGGRQLAVSISESDGSMIDQTGRKLGGAASALTAQDVTDTQALIAKDAAGTGTGGLVHAVAPTITGPFAVAGLSRVERTGTPDVYQAVTTIHRAINNSSTGGYGHRFNFTQSGTLTTGFAIAHAIIAGFGGTTGSNGGVSGSQGQGQWLVVATPVGQSKNWGVCGMELDVMNLGGDEGYGKRRAAFTRWTVGMQLVAESQDSVYGGGAIANNALAAYVSARNNSKKIDGDYCGWYNAFLVERDSVAPGGRGLLASGATATSGSFTPATSLAARRGYAAIEIDEQWNYGLVCDLAIFQDNIASIIGLGHRHAARASDGTTIHPLIGLTAAGVVEIGSTAPVQVKDAGGVVRLATGAVGLGFNGATPIAKPAVTGSRGGNAALASLLTQLAALGLITDSSTA